MLRPRPVVPRSGRRGHVPRTDPPAPERHNPASVHGMRCRNCKSIVATSTATILLVFTHFCMLLSFSHTFSSAPWAGSRTGGAPSLCRFRTCPIPAEIGVATAGRTPVFIRIQNYLCWALVPADLAGEQQQNPQLSQNRNRKRARKRK